MHSDQIEYLRTDEMIWTIDANLHNDISSNHKLVFFQSHERLPIRFSFIWSYKLKLCNYLEVRPL